MPGPEKRFGNEEPSPTGLFFVVCLWDEGIHPVQFCVEQAASRRSVAETFLAEPYRWGRLLRRAGFYEAAPRGDRPCHKEPHPLSADALLARTSTTRVDGDRRAQLTVLPVPEIEETARP